MKKLYVISIFLLQFHSAFAQEAEGFFPVNNNLIPPSPNAASLGKYAEYPVNLYTGIPQIEIPLYEIQSGSLKLPVSLSYHASGIKVEEIASWVGLGWTLNAGGVITRTIHGVPDEKPGWGYLSQISLPDPYALNQYDPDDYALLKGAAEGTRDWEPDEYYFNFNGRSGQFVMGIDGTVYPIQYEDLLISGSPATDWTIVTEDGTRYLFKKTERTHTYATCDGNEETEVISFSSWYLTQIISADNRSSISLSYKSNSETGTDEMEQVTFSETAFVSDDGGGALWQEPPNSVCSNTIMHDAVRIDKISYPGGSMLFQKHTSEREDISNDFSLDEVIVKDRFDQVIKRFQLAHSYSGTFLTKRLRLESVTEISAGGESHPPYKFEYYTGPDLPSTESNAQDHWGYYNGAGDQQTMIPTLAVGLMYISAGNREPDSIYCKAGTLNKITYPTGGYSQFDFEINQYGEEAGQTVSYYDETPHSTGAHADADLNGGQETEDIVVFEIQYPQWVELSYFLNPPSGADNNGEASVSLVYPDGTNDYTTQDGKKWLGTGTYSLIAFALGDGVASINVDYSTVDSSDVSTLNKNKLGGGLRIRKMIRSDGDEDHSNDLIKIYDYNSTTEMDRSSGVLISKPWYTYGVYIFRPTQHAPVPVHFSAVSSSSQAILGQSKGGFVGYTEVTEKSFFVNNQNQLQSALGKTYYKYRFEYNQRSNFYPFPPPLSPDWRRGLLLEKTSFDESGKKVVSTVNDYQFGSAVSYEVKGIKVGYVKNNPLFGAGVDEFAPEGYNYLSESSFLSKSTETLFNLNDDSKSISSTTQYFFDNPLHLQPSRIVTTRSDGSIETKATKYPQDYAVTFDGISSNPMYSALHHMIYEDHIHNRPIEQFIKIETPLIDEDDGGGGSGNQLGGPLNTAKVIQGSLATYRLINNEVVFDSVFILDLAAPILTSDFDTSSVWNNIFKHDARYRCANYFAAYDDSLHPNILYRPFDKHLSVIYDYPSGKVGALASNADVAEIAWSGFEGTAQGGWSYNQLYVKEADNSAFTATVTGSHFYWPTVAVSKQNIPAGKYLLTFWSTYLPLISGSSYTIENQSTGETINGYTYREYLLNFTTTGSISLAGSAGYIDELRFYPADAYMTTYAYDLAGQLTETCDENNYITHFGYDNFQRFNYSADHFLNGLSSIVYHYKDELNADDHNFIRTETARAAGLNEASLTSGTLPKESSLKEVQYFDGLGRIIQSVSTANAPNGINDFVVPNEYDAFGRELKNYLPYSTAVNSGGFKTDAINAQATFYQTSSDLQQTDFAYTENLFEASPLSRPVVHANPGEAWKLGNHNIKKNYRTNEANEVRRWVFSSTSESWLGNSFYAANTLFVVDSTGENGNKFITYKDKCGLTILAARQKQEEVVFSLSNYAQTYYVYDEMNRLIMVITPQCMRELTDAGTFTFAQSKADLWNFQYQYNERSQISAKRIPAQDDWTWLIYDQLDRQALMQDPNLRLEEEWHYQKYDVHGRPVLSGLAISDNSNEEWQQQFWDATSDLFETPYASSSGYSNNAIPFSAGTEETINYYDDYDFNGDGSADYSADVTGVARSRNKATGIFTKVLDENSSTFIANSSFYDYKNQVLEIKGTNFKGKLEKNINTYDFSGNVISTEREHNYSLINGQIKLNRSLSVKYRYEYDHANRLLNAYLQTDEEPEIWLNHLSYNSIGKNKQKKLQCNPTQIFGNVTAQQTIDYHYNERGWITKINDIDDFGLSGSDYFAMRLHYDEGSGALNAADQFCGNISWVEWRSRRDSMRRYYGYSYDMLNRLTASKYKALDLVSGLYDEEDRYSVSNLTHDDNGNILSMKVNGVLNYDSLTKVFSYGVADDLTYTYNGNRLTSVRDIGYGVWNEGLDFRDQVMPERHVNLSAIDLSTEINLFDAGEINKPNASGSSSEYAYDANGSLIHDGNKGIEIKTNHLNLPDEIKRDASHKLTVLYDASGNKLKEVTIENGKEDSVEYFSEILEEQGTPKRILHADGYLLKDAEGKWKPYYYIKDHLGNIRIVFRGDTIMWKNYDLTMEPGDLQNASNAGFENIQNHADSTISFQEEYSAKVSNATGPYIELPVKRGDTLQANVFYYFQSDTANSQLRSSETEDTKQFPLVSIGTVPQRNAPADAIQKKHPQLGLGINITGLFDLLSKHNKKEPDAYRDDSEPSPPESYLHIELKDSANNVLQDWKYNVEDENTWKQIGDSMSFKNLDSTGNYKLKISLQNEDEEITWYDTLSLRLGTVGSPIIQESHYYPFGNLIDGLCWQAEDEDINRYLYNSKPLIRSLKLNWLDYGARWYDPQVGRWWVIDPLADSARNYSVFNYAFSNPLNFIDPNGLSSEDIRLFGTNNSSITVTTDLMSADVSVPYDFGGQYTFSGEEVVQLALDVVGIADPTGAADAMNAGLYARNGEYGQAIISSLGIILPWFGDAAKGPRLVKGIDKIYDVIKAQKVPPKGVEKAIVIGEGMAAVRGAAKTLQSQGINAKWYQAWSKNFPTDRLMTPSELIAALERNERWIKSKINQGYKIYDIGTDATRATRSPFYQLEHSILQQRGYPVITIPR